MMMPIVICLQNDASTLYTWPYPAVQLFSLDDHLFAIIIIPEAIVVYLCATPLLYFIVVLDLFTSVSRKTIASR